MSKEKNFYGKNLFRMTDMFVLNITNEGLRNRVTLQLKNIIQWNNVPTDKHLN